MSEQMGRKALTALAMEGGGTGRAQLEARRSGVMRVVDILARYVPADHGDADTRTWRDEFKYLWRREGVYTESILDDIREHGIQEPLLLGHDGSLMDGHHRLAAAVRLGLDTVPVVHAERRADHGCCDTCYEAAP